MRRTTRRASLPPWVRRGAITTALPNSFSTASTYANLLAVLLRKNFRPQRWFALLYALPVCSAVCDWLENAATFTMLRQYPDISPAMAGAGSICATLKTLTGFLTLAGILLLSLRWLWRYYKARRG